MHDGEDSLMGKRYGKINAVHAFTDNCRGAVAAQAVVQGGASGDGLMYHRVENNLPNPQPVI